MKHVPFNIQLFGPAHAADAVSDVASSPKWIGSVLSNSTYWLEMSHGLAELAKARFTVFWTPRNTANYVRLVHADNGPSNIVEIARIQSNGLMTPTGQAVDVTAAMNALIAAGVDKHIGFQVGGDGVNQWTMNNVRLEMIFKVPEAGGAMSAPPVELEHPGSILKRIKQWEADQIEVPE